MILFLLATTGIPFFWAGEFPACLPELVILLYQRIAYRMCLILKQY
jgi:hypothetical protein